MACLNMQQQQQQQQMKNEKGLMLMGPRISFSNDFVESKSHNHENMSYREAPVSSDDFEFSVPSFSSNSADEVFFKRIPPLKQVITLRDELLAGDDDDDGDRRCKNNSSTTTGWWREKFGLRKSQRKVNHGGGGGGLETIHEAKIKPSFDHYTSNFTGSHHEYK